ncbi:hypothetical protein MKS88_005823 [Plasmodium brasilianum]|uniref:Uncharacterized protein n=2 Tax=Plasmodium (Plasmodium) TaxID=418103 RepID=A0A1D3TFJ8_PLAMA|nr:conserved Plasmodium protein, unknown function [Plasmodium malariae]KAI4835139.1 hypothetical protein MKS88_005823 [Plasmodium brasilianum]SCP03720.1 conserved Plasmodium protein, unknown function [Plasmodium malariae]
MTSSFLQISKAISRWKYRKECYDQFYNFTQCRGRMKKKGISLHVKGSIWNRNIRKDIKFGKTDKEEKKEVINLNLDRKGITSSKDLLKYIGKNKKLLLYILCKIDEKKNKYRGQQDVLNDLEHNINEKIVEEELSLRNSEKMIFLSCASSKYYAEKIHLIRNDNNGIYIDEKNLFNYYCTVLKYRKNNSLNDKEIDDDILTFFKSRMNIRKINSISLYLLNLSYLNSKTTIKTNVLYNFVLYMLKYIKNKITNRTGIILLTHYVDLLTSIMHVSKLKIETSSAEVGEENTDSINKIRMVNKNEYPFDCHSFSNLCKNSQVMIHAGHNDAKKSGEIISYDATKFYHYFNIYDFVCNREGYTSGDSAAVVTTRAKDGIAVGGVQQTIDALSMNKTSGSTWAKIYDIRSEIIYMIYYLNAALVCLLKKCVRNCKKDVHSKRFDEPLEKRLYVIINYMFNCLQYNVFCKTLFLLLQQVLIIYMSNNMRKYHFRYLSTSSIAHLVHLLSIQYSSVKIDDDNEKLIMLKNCLNKLFTNDCKDLGKKDKLLTYISVSKILFFSKKVYIEKMHNILSSELINFTYRDLYSVVYSLNCSKFYDLPFFESVLRNIYKLKHKYEQSRVLTIITVFCSFNVNLAIFNFLMAYANKNDMQPISREGKNEIPEFNRNQAKKLEEDLENKERILKELSSHIKENHNADNITFEELDTLELNSGDSVLKCDDSEERSLMNDEEIKRYLKKRKKKRKK